LSQPVAPTRTFDARLRLLESAKPLAHGTRARLHHGTRATNARIRLFGLEELAAGGSAFARLRLDEPLVVLPGDRFVLRSLGPQVTVGGGTVLDAAPGSRRPEPGWLGALETGDAASTVPLLLARSPRQGMTAADLSLALSVPPEEIAAGLERVPEVASIGDLYALATEVEAAKKRLLEALEERAEERAEDPALSVAKARVATGLATGLADVLLGEMVSSGEVRVTDDGLTLPEVEKVPPELEREANQLVEGLRRAGAEPPAMETTPALRLLLKRGDAVGLGERLFASKEAADAVFDEIKAVCREEGEISLAGLRDRLGTSRKYAQAWLEFSDEQQVTRRTGDVRVLTRRYRP
ncbi:MAG TPA: SelB C-terminal domain-containing protein, partial [Rubrobacteraceae bacterium]|nr:SelB C-terminal domain-containing protein [Rubrobacteraceae bacterium]